jgi:hypothetical protein
MEDGSSKMKTVKRKAVEPVAKSRKAYVILSVPASILIKTGWDKTIQIALSGPGTKAEVLAAIACWIVGLCAFFWALHEA